MARSRPLVDFVPLVRSGDLGRAPLRVRFDDLAVALFRDARGVAAAILDRCPHRFASLADGRVRPDGRLACPYHGWHFDERGAGKSPSQPERTDCDTIAFPVLERHGAIWVGPPGAVETTLDAARAAAPEGEWVNPPGPRSSGARLGRRLLDLVGMARAETREVRVARFVPAVRLRTAPAPFVVAKREQETSDITSFTLVPASASARILPYRAGQHVTIRVRPVANGPLVNRSYSLSDAPREDGYRISVKRVSGAGRGLVSNHLHDDWACGTPLELMPPAGEFVIPDEDRPLLLVAAGVGITPLFAMARAWSVEERRRPVRLLYGVRHASDVFRPSELAALASRGVDVRLFVSGGDASSCPLPATAGRLDEAALRTALALDPDVFVCGPEAMMTEALATLSKLGVPRERVHAEKFVKATPTIAASFADCRVTFSRSGKVVPWSAADGTLLELAGRHGVELESGCQVGSCETCRLPLTSGEIVSIGTAREREKPGSCLVCIAVPKGDVVLDA